MVSNIVSQYVTIMGKQNILREWVCSILLNHGHFYNLVEVKKYGSCDVHLICRLLGIFPGELDDENKLYDTLIDLQQNVQNSQYDEGDPFCINTRWIQTAMGLGETELALLRFYLLAIANGGLKEALLLHKEEFLEPTLCEFLADFLRLPADEVHSALAPDSPLKRSGLLRLPFSHGLCRDISNWVDVEPLLVDRVFRSYEHADQILNVIYSTSKPSNLSLSAFEHLGPGFPVINDYLSAAVTEGKPGVNILLWGEPGTGKTELARALSESCGVQALEVANLDADGDPLHETERMAQYRLGQYMFGRSRGSIFIFDEVERILCDVNFALFGIQGKDNQFGKASVNSLLENNRVPAIWIGNTIKGIDPAYLRRFDFCLKVDLPKGEAAKKLASDLLKEVPVGAPLLNQIAENSHITPAALEKASRIYQTIEPNSADANVIVCQTINSDLKVKGVENDKLLDPEPSLKQQSSYSLEYLNTDTDIETLSDSISGSTEARLCLYGPPGTGKSAWAEYLAKKLKLQLMVKRASDIIDPYLGGTERNIADMFKEAQSKNALLLIDEADSFLQNREHAQRQWEISQVNEFLTRMEEFKGLLVCTTNLMGTMDAATLRRFDFKIRLNYLEVDQAVNLASTHLCEMNCPLSSIDVHRLRTRMSTLEVTPGDFKVLQRRYRVTGRAPSTSQFLDDLTRETEFRIAEKKRPIGFTVDIEQRIRR